MIVTAKREVEVTIIMTESEAWLLRGMLQNPVCADESENERSLREDIWGLIGRELPNK